MLSEADRGVSGRVFKLPVFAGCCWNDGSGRGCLSGRKLRNAHF